MQFSKWFHRGNAADQLKASNPFVGIAAANTVAGLGIIRDQARLKQAVEVRQIARTLGMPPTTLEDEMLAGGNITVNQPGGSGGWIALVAVLLALLCGGVAYNTWLTTHPGTTGATSTTPAPPSAPTTPVSPTTPQRNQDYIEFYVP